MLKYIGFIITIVIGMSMVIKTEMYLNFFGNIEWAETHFGGSRFFYKILGVVIIILSAMMITGWLEEIFIGIFTPGA